MSEIDSARRVVLLARPGPARERMREALAQAGAAVALEADPIVADPGEVSAVRPDVALIVLDAATDEALDRFDALLSDPSVEVLFEEADLVIAREGWDAARWVRHLTAKLHRTGDVLPPGGDASPAPTAAAPAPAAPISAAPVAAAPVAAVPEPAAPPAAVEPPPLPEPATAPQWTLSEIPDLPEPTTPVAASADATPLVMPELESTAFDLPAATPPSLAGLELPDLDMSAAEPASPGPGFQSTFDVHGDLTGLETSEISLAPLQLDEEFLTTPGDSVAPLEGLELPGENATGFATNANPPAVVEPPPLPPARFELSLVDDDAAPAKTAASAAPVAPSSLSLEDLETPDTAGVAGRFQNDLDDLHSRIASMELVVDRPASQVRGAVLVLAGIGGPDAVRQLLGALPNNFPRAVLVQQRLDGGHYDKLVAQMQRATQLLVELAVPGRPLHASSVYILAPSIGVESGPDGLAFTDTPGDLLASLPAGDSAVLMLSGSDPNQVDAVMKLSAGGALVAAQALDGCYDVAAPAALASRGGDAAKPQDLARRLAERWAA